MKKDFARFWHTLSRILKLLWLYVLLPLFGYLKRKARILFQQGTQIFQQQRHKLDAAYWKQQRHKFDTDYWKQHRHKLTLPYWQQQYARLRTYNWRSIQSTNSFKPSWQGVRRIALILILSFFVFYLAVYAGLLGNIPSRTELREKQNNTASEVYSADSVLLGRYYLQDRTNVKYKDIAQDAIHALIATEDARFYDHHGIDVRSLARVLIKTLLLQDDRSGGGSTISQQLAKNLYPRKNYWLFSTPINKLREYIIARRLEKVYNKEEILELYLNTVPLGGNLYGIERASRRFFNTTADSLTTEQAAVLIGMLKATTTYNPRLNPDKSRERRNVVLSQMAKYGYLPEAKADDLKKLPLKLNYRYETHNDGLAPYFREQLRLELAAWCKTQTKENGEPYNLYTDGLKIYTTLHAGLQQQAERAVAKRMALLQSQFKAHWKGRSPWGNKQEVIQTAMERSDRYRKLKAAGKSDKEIRAILEKPIAMTVFSWNGTTKQTMSPMDSLRYYAKFLNAGLLAIDPSTGFVRAWVGGIHHQFFKYDHVKAKRQAGSTFKPIVYTAALEQGMQPCQYFSNQRYTYKAYQNWSPRNADNRYGGKYSMAGALAHSVNTVSAQVLMQTGIKPTIALARRMGIQSDLPAVPSLALGTASLSLMELVSAYATFANDGIHIKPEYISRITDSKGSTIYKLNPREGIRRAIAYETAVTMLQLMQQVVSEGSGKKLRTQFNLQMDIAGKTGTTQNQTDGWFIGITPDLVTGVWVGAEDPAVHFRTLALGQGSSTALPVWGEFMSRVSRSKSFSNFGYSRFPPIPAQVKARLACTSYQDDAPVYVVKESFFDRLFGKRDRKKADKKQREREKKWEEERREAQKKREERRRERQKKWEEEQRERWKN